MKRRQWMQAQAGMVGMALMAGWTRGDEPVDESDPANLMAKLGPMLATVPVEVVELAPALHLVTGPGGNIAVHKGTDGLTVVDTSVPTRAQESLDAALRVGGRPLRRVINTHWHFDHAGGNEIFARTGATLISTPATRDRLATEQYTEAFRMTTPPSPPAALPTLVADRFDLRLGTDVIEITSVPPAHTDGDLVVHFRAQDVIHTGDLFSNGFYPNIDASSRGWIGGMVAAADRILKLAGPKTRIIPGHGPVATPADLAAFRQMLSTLHDRLAPMADAGKTYKDVVAARPTADLDPTWGKGLFTGSMFARLAYDGLLKHRATAKP